MAEVKGHVFCWVAAFGWTLMPASSPFRIERVPGQRRSIRVLCGEEDDDLREAIVTISDDGEEWNAVPVPITAVVRDAVEVLEGAAYSQWESGARYDDWRIETTPFSICWPEGFTLASLPNSTSAKFELIGPGESRICIQGPIPESKLPRIQDMVTPGQSLLRVAQTTAGPMVEAAYSHEGSAWRMLHCVVRWPGRYAEPGNRMLSAVRKLLPGTRTAEAHVGIVTAQTPREEVDQVRLALEQIAASLTETG